MSQLLVDHAKDKQRSKVARIKHFQNIAIKQQHHQEALAASERHHVHQIQTQQKAHKQLTQSTNAVQKATNEMVSLQNIAAYNASYTSSREFRLNGVFNAIRAITDCLIDHECFNARTIVGNYLTAFGNHIGDHSPTFKQLHNIIGTKKWIQLASAYRAHSSVQNIKFGVFEYLSTMFLAYVLHMEEDSLKQVRLMCLRFIFLPGVSNSDIESLANWFASNEAVLADESAALKTAEIAMIHGRLNNLGYEFPYPEMDLTISNPSPVKHVPTEQRLKGWSCGNERQIHEALDYLLGG